ncbi:MAG: hypothetical protein ABI660_16830 [Polaromonas sp.]
MIEEQAIARPMVAVTWAKGQSDLMRDEGGKAVWTREPDTWLATVLDLEEVGPMSGQHPLTELHSLPFFLRSKAGAPNLEGCALDCEGGKLVVHELAT